MKSGDKAFDSRYKIDDERHNERKETKMKYYHNLRDDDVDRMEMHEFSSENDFHSEPKDYYQEEEPVINKTLVMLQKDMHKSLFSPSLMKINESPKVSLLTDRSKATSKDHMSSTNMDAT